MHDDELEPQLREALRAYRAPPEPPLDVMWDEIERRHFGRPIASIGSGAAGITSARAAARAERRWRLAPPSWTAVALAVAAALFLGVSVGRISRQLSPDLETRPYTLAEGAYNCSAMSCNASDPYRQATSEYLGRTAALLTALPAEVRAGMPDGRFVSQASDLLSTTRLLLDSPSAADQRLVSLLEDLELVLAQIARLPASRGAAELDLITEALEQRDVVPRLRSAVVGISSADN